MLEVNKEFLNQNVPIPNNEEVHKASFQLGVLRTLKALEANSTILVSDDVKAVYNKKFGGLKT